MCGKGVPLMDKVSLALELQEKGMNRTQIWKELGYSECSGLTKLMRSKGYEYNINHNKYECIGQKSDIRHQVSLKPLNSELSQLTVSEELQTKLFNLVERYSELDEMLEWYKQQKVQERDGSRTTVVEVINQGIQIKLPKVESIKVSVRVNKDVWEVFGEFAVKHSEFAKGDLLCQALKEYMDKHS